MTQFLLSVHQEEKLSHFDVNRWVTGGTKIWHNFLDQMIQFFALSTERKKLSHFDSKSWVTGGTYIRPNFLGQNNSIFLSVYREKKLSHSDLKSWVTGGSKSCPSLTAGKTYHTIGIWSQTNPKNDCLIILWNWVPIVEKSHKRLTMRSFLPSIERIIVRVNRKIYVPTCHKLEEHHRFPQATCMLEEQHGALLVGVIKGSGTITNGLSLSVPTEVNWARDFTVVEAEAWTSIEKTVSWNARSFGSRNYLQYWCLFCSGICSVGLKN